MPDVQPDELLVVAASEQSPLPATDRVDHLFLASFGLCSWRLLRRAPPH